MASHTRASLSRRVSAYKNMRTIPAILGVAFVVASLYQFGGITEVQLEWVGYTLTQEHAALASVGVFLVAFMSSETRDFQYYETWEQGLIASGPVAILGIQYTQELEDIVLMVGDPLGYQVAFLLTLVSWGVAVGK